MADTDKAASKPDAEDQPTTSRISSQRSPSPTPSQMHKRTKPASLVSAPSSVGESPKTSREPSPSRSGFKLQSNTSRLSRSRKNSQELNRGNAFAIPDTPSPAAIQRALAAAGPARQSPLTTSDDTKSQKSSRAPSATRSVRLTSPPPVSSNNKRDLEPPPTPSIIVNQATPKSATSFENIEEEGEQQMLTPDMRSPRSAITASRLEAVQESVDPETPALASGSKPFFNEGLARGETAAETPKDKSSILSLESGNESAGGRSITSNATVENKAARPVLHPRNSSSQMTIKNKNPTDGTIRNMTVETETVVSMPSMTVGAPADARNTSGKQDPSSTLRMKPSTETMRPRKEKKKTIRKAPSLASTTGTSKADIFEAKVKNAVEQADSSDSEETFVYESNPPEPVPQRNHSRTPSMTSIASYGDYYRGRYRQDAGSSLAGKKSMKFANNAKNVSNYPSTEDTSSIDQTLMNALANPTTASTQFPRHIGRHGRHPAHLSLFDNDAPFNNNARSPRKATAGSFTRKASPRPHTPRSANFRAPATGKSYGTHYDLEADDERTPLISSIRSVRSRRRGAYDAREEDFNYLQPRSPLRRAGACMCFGSLFSLLVAMVVAFLILCSRPLQNVRLKSIGNVLASDKSIIFDLQVQAINPNIIGVQITDMSLYVHAKSSYVGDSKWWREHGGHDGSGETEVDAQGGVDEGTDPIGDDSHLMLVGQVSAFDAPLSFDASPWHHIASTSVGEVRLERPSNSSEVDKDRWEMVFYHDFDLIVRGVLKYTLPISSRVRTAEVSGTTHVKPTDLPKPIQDPPDPEPEPDEPKKGNGTSLDKAHIFSNTRLKRYQSIPIQSDKTLAA